MGIVWFSSRTPRTGAGSSTPVHIHHKVTIQVSTDTDMVTLPDSYADYTVGDDSLDVYVNGLLKANWIDYEEVEIVDGSGAGRQVKFLSPLKPGDVVTLIYRSCPQCIVTDPTAVAITSISPANGTTAGGNTVVIEGRNFDPAVEVYFGDIQAEVSAYFSDSMISVIVPASSTVGVVDVRVVNPGNKQAIKRGGYTYVGQVKITEIVPNKGLTTGGETVTIRGEFLSPYAQVYFGDELATDLTFISPNEITVKTPPHLFGDVDVRVVNPEGTEFTLPEAFFYDQAPTATSPIITGMSFTAQSNRWLVYVDGGKFDNNIKVYADGVEAQLMNYYSADRIRVAWYFADLSPGVHRVWAVNPNGEASNTFEAEFPAP